MKNYLLTVLQQCSEEKFGQDAIEWAIITGRVKLTYNLRDDVRNNVPDGLPDEINYDRIIEAYRAAKTDLEAQTMDAMQPLLEEILRPVSLAQQIPERLAA